MTQRTNLRPMWTVLASGLVWLLAACALSRGGTLAAAGDMTAHAPSHDRTL